MNKPHVMKLSNYHALLPPRPREAYKELFGHVLAIGGGPGMGGAIRLAGEAALRVGAGLVTVATQPQHTVAIMSTCPEIMTHGIDNPQELTPLFAKATVIVVGPGLGQTIWARRLLETVLQVSQPKVVDADALNLLAEHSQQSDNWILTPHPGEAARLLRCHADDIQADRVNAAKQLQQQYGGVIVLKGAGSLVCSTASLNVCEAGNPGMATGGMGDVLSGVISGLLAQRLSLQQAAEFAVCLHAAAGDAVAGKQGQRGMLATDLMPCLTALVNL